ncbi:MAG: hypothetical protein R3310_07780 [Candidatus Competibacteraceae bacterium]|nr:hypothetical protein [Candidatus Competibacteraceae bacterium]
MAPQGPGGLRAGRYDPPSADRYDRNRGLSEAEDAYQQVYQSGYEEARQAAEGKPPGGPIRE